ncbi:hypothetical protein GCM10029992_38100 [Glycomyces albus]
MLTVFSRLNGVADSVGPALGVAAAWPGPGRPTVVELDPAGGMVAARWRMRPDPGLADIAAQIASRPQAGPETLAEGVQHLPVVGVRVPVVCSAAGGEAARRALEFLAAGDSKVLSPPDGAVIADIGPFDTASPAWPVACAADAVVVLVEGTLEGIAHLRARAEVLAALSRLGPGVGVVVFEREYTADEVDEVFLAAGLRTRVIGAAGPLDSLGPKRASAAGLGGHGRHGRPSQRRPAISGPTRRLPR